MTIQELIDKLNDVEDKSLPVIHYYDQWNFNLRSENIEVLTLYTNDNGENIEEFKESDDDVEIKCLRINGG